MKNILNFLVQVNRLKEMPRTGWVLREVKNPETIADHLFRIAVASWLLGRKKNLNLKKIIKIALSHDLCEVYAGDIPPFFYYLDLPKEKKKKKEFLRKWVRLSKKEKEKMGKVKTDREKKSLLRLIKYLTPEQKQDIFSSWLDYEKMISKEGKFVRQVDKIETLLQAIEYFGTKKDSLASSWWEECEEIVEDKLLLNFLKVIQKKFYRRGLKREENEKDLENILNFLLEIGKLKRLPRLYWVLRGVENPETVAGHIFTLTLMAWIFGKETGLNSEKLLKMALCHEISAVYTGDTTPYDRILPKDSQKRKEILKRMIRLSIEKKEKISFKNYQEEKKTIEKLTLKLEPALRNEIIRLWEEYRTKSTSEGYFLSQLNVLAVLLQALLYEQKDKNFFVAPVWEWALETVDHPLVLKLLREMKKKFYAQ